MSSHGSGDAPGTHLNHVKSVRNQKPHNQKRFSSFSNAPNVESFIIRDSIMGSAPRKATRFLCVEAAEGRYLYV